MSALVLKYLTVLTEKVWQMLRLDHSIKIIALYLEEQIFISSSKELSFSQNNILAKFTTFSCRGIYT